MHLGICENYYIQPSVKEIHSPSLGSIALIVSKFTGIGGSYICWFRKECIKGEVIADLFGSNNEIQTESECTRPEFECESSNAWPNILATKLFMNIFKITGQVTKIYTIDNQDGDAGREETRRN